MKKILNVFIITMFIIILSGCNELTDPDYLRQSVIKQIEFYMEANEYIESINNESLDDVEESISYISDDFFNYDSKATLNVELEYDDFYVAFGQLLFVKNVVENIENFEYDKFFKDVVTNETIYVQADEGLLNIEYFEYLIGLDAIIRHSYFLKTVNDEVHMEKYLEIYDCDFDEVIIIKSFSVFGDRYVESYEYYPETSSFSYTYNSKEEQEYFKYKGTLDNGQFIRQTVEYYIAPYRSYVSFDLKDDKLEDYRIKIFDKGHRVVKIDVNVKSNNPTINELTWNLLSVSGWDSIEYVLEDYYIYKGSYNTLEDYDINVQFKGYGKVEAYKLFEGEMTESDVSLVNYDLDSGITLDMANNAKLYFKSNYVAEMLKYGFVINDEDNKFIVYNAIKPTLEISQKFKEYIDYYK